MIFTYTTAEAHTYNFSKLGGHLDAHNRVILTEDAYRRFVEETWGTSHTLVLYKETPLERID